MIKRIGWFFLVILIGLAMGIGLMLYFQQQDQPDPEEQSQVLMEKIQKVCKLVTVEGHLVEYFDYGDPEPGPLWGPFYQFNYRALMPRKSVRMRIKAKVLVGYDLSNIRVDAFPDQKLIQISRLPDPEILSIDTDVDYFDEQETWVNPLKDEDYERVMNGAKEKIREAAMTSELLDSAAEQGNDLFDLMEFMVTNAGWTLEVMGAETEVPDSKDDLWKEIE